jgi:galactokinase
VGEAVRAFGPGRINVIGEHTDYNEGLCLPFAIALGVTVVLCDADDGVLDVHALDVGERDVIDLGAEPIGAQGWRAFVRGAVAELQRAGLTLRGGAMTIAGDVPRGSGLSSSAALEVALVLALLAHSGHPEPDRRELARLCARIENDWVGADTGLLDQLAALLSRPGEAVRLDLRTLEATHVDLALDGWRFVTLDSGVAHSHASSGYNERREECRAACRALGIASLRDADAAGAASLPEPLGRRVRHVLDENARVDAATAALERGDLPALGRLLDASHASLRDQYEVSIPAVEGAVVRLRRDGAAGARIMGGGFGGAVLALFPPYAEPPPGAVIVRPGPGARLL